MGRKAVEDPYKEIGFVSYHKYNSIQDREPRGSDIVRRIPSNSVE